MSVQRETEIDRLFFALSDQTRRKMLKRLVNEQVTIGDLGEFGMTKQAVSKHLKVLEDAGLVTKEKQGRVQLCQLNQTALELVQQIVAEYSVFWDRQMAGLDEYIKNKMEI